MPSAAGARRSVALYVSGHGFGHAVRQIEVVNALASIPDLEVVIRTLAPAWLFERGLRRPVRVESCATDTGIVQFDGLRLDADQTIDQAAAFYAELDARADVEAAWLMETRVSLVLTDTPPLACAAAARASVPSVVVGNFTWDWIYGAYTDSLPRHPWLVDSVAGAYAAASQAWRLPMCGGFASITTITDVPFVARHSRRDPVEIRLGLGLPTTLPLALCSFGGYGLSSGSLGRIDPGAFGVVTVSSGTGDLQLHGPEHRVFALTESVIYERGYRYEDVVRAVDVVITKPGYGIISECIANATSILYTSRGDFVEYDLLTREMPRYLACEYIDHDDLFAGRWAESLARLHRRPRPGPAPRTDGATVIADLVQECLA